MDENMIIHTYCHVDDFCNAFQVLHLETISAKTATVHV